MTYILDTIHHSNIIFSANMNIKRPETVLNIARALYNAGRNTFTAEDIQYIVNKNVKASHNKVIANQVIMTLRDIVRSTNRQEKYHGHQFIYALGMGFYRYGE